MFCLRNRVTGVPNLSTDFITWYKMAGIVDEIYVINMAREVERLVSFDSMMKSRHDNTRWNYTRVSAINGKLLKTGVQESSYNKEERVINCKGTLFPRSPEKLKEKYIGIMNWLSVGEVGCFLSHVFLWELVRDSPSLNRIMVFEDDARTHADVSTVQDLLRGFYSHLESEGIHEPHMLYLGKALDKCSNYEHIWNNVYKSCHPLCLHAYIITKEGARRLLERGPFDIPIDIIPTRAANRKDITIMVFHPSLYFQDIMNNTSALRAFEMTLNLTSECLVDYQHMSDVTLWYLGMTILAFSAALVLFVLYIFLLEDGMWTNASP